MALSSGHVVDFSNAIVEQADGLVEAAGTLPTGADYGYYSTYMHFPSKMNTMRDMSLELLEGLVTHEVLGITKTSDRSWGDAVLDSLDCCFENVDNVLDELSGRKETTNRKRKKHQEREDKIKGILRPQSKFHPPPNNSNAPFRIRLYEEEGAWTEGDPNRHYCATAITQFVPTLEMIHVVEEQPYATLQATACNWIGSLQELIALKEELATEEAIAVSMQSHSYRTFQGFICLLQISTRTKDFLIDALELHNQLHLLNNVFKDPNIVKVVHSGRHGLEGLQRDFGAYMVNIFDIAEATNALGFHCSLVELLHMQCGLQLNEKFQLADWRIRPLPSAMLDYAREASHYLLFLFDRMRTLLCQTGLHNNVNNPVQHVFELSKKVCLKKYEKQLWTSHTVADFINAHNLKLPHPNLQVLGAVLHWRDEVARDVDESLSYVLPDNMVVNIAKTKPTTKLDLLNVCHPIPKLLRQNAIVLVNAIKCSLVSHTNTDCQFAESESNVVRTGTSSLVAPCDGFSNNTVLPITTTSDTASNMDSNAVLSAESLYHQAGWTEQAGSTNSVPTTINKPAAHTPSTGSLTFGALRSKLSLPEEKQNFASSTKPVGGASPATSQSSQSSMAMNKAQYTPPRNTASAAPHTPMFHCFLFGDKPNTNSTIDVGNFLENIAMEAQGHSNTNMRPDFFGSPKVRSSGDDEIVSPRSPSSVTDLPANVDNQAEVGVPQSLGEIYCLSKANKKRNKDKKKLKEASVANPTPAFATKSTSDEGSAGNGQSMEDFMVGIGWTDNKALEVMKNSTELTKEGGVSGGGHGGGSHNVQTGMQMDDNIPKLHKGGVHQPISHHSVPYMAHHQHQPMYQHHQGSQPHQHQHMHNKGPYKHGKKGGGGMHNHNSHTYCQYNYAPPPSQQ